MKGSRALTYVLALALVFSLTACDDNGGGMDDDDDDNGDEPTLLSDILGERDDLSTLFQAVDASGQLNLTEDPNADITVFAPNNSAFADINLEAALSDDNSALLEEVVQYHVLPQSVLSSGLSEGTVETALGDEILITTDDNGNFLVNGNSITTADLEADNGVLHVIDGLLLENRTLLQRLGLTSSTQALLGIASEANLGDAFSTAENWTVFAPINGALDEVNPADFSQEQLQQILQYHVIVDENGPIDAATLQTLLADNGGEVEVETAQGEPITFTETDDGNIVLNDGAALVDGGTDRFAGGVNETDDGFVNVFHLIDGLLMPPSMQETTTIADVVANDDSFSTLLTALQQAGLADALGNEEATFTVFAPNNDAFGPINTDVLLGQADALEAVLGYHVVPDQALAASDLAEGENTVTTLAGDELTVVRNGDNVFVEGSQVVDADNETDNGIIHVIDRALLGNQNLANTAWFVSETEQLYNTVVDFGLADAFVNASGWTVFGPNNATFENADLSGFSEEEVQQVLQYHVYAESVVDSGGLVGLLEDNSGTVTIPTLQGEDLTIAQDGDQIVFNDGQATLDMANLDYAASNGVLHVINGLLLPPSFTEAEAISIADAREQGVDAEVTIEGTVTRAFGDFVRIQDGSGDLGASGMVIRQTGGSFNDEIADGTITEGTTLRITGTISEFNGLLQINEGDLASYEITGEASVPEPITITLTELANSGLDYESVLVRINGLTLNTEDTEFSNGTSYTAADGDGNEGVFRVQQEGETQLIGEPVPSGSFDYEGVIGQFQGEPQMIPVEVSDIIQE